MNAVAPGFFVADQNRRLLLEEDGPDAAALEKPGSIVAALERRLSSAGLGADVMPALGTHRAMGPDDARVMFGDAIPAGRLLQHRWRDDVVEIGAIAAEEVDEIAGAELGCRCRSRSIVRSWAEATSSSWRSGRSFRTRWPASAATRST